MFQEVFTQSTTEQREAAKKIPDFEQSGKETYAVNVPKEVDRNPEATNAIESVAAHRGLVQREYDRAKSVYQSGILDKEYAFSALFDDTTAGKAIDWFKYDHPLFRIEDDKFRETLTQNKVDMYMKYYGLSTAEQKATLMRAKNQDHLELLAEQEMWKQKSKETVEKHMTLTEQQINSFVVEAGTDPTNIATGLGGMAIGRAINAARKYGRIQSVAADYSKAAKTFKAADYSREGRTAGSALYVTRDIQQAEHVASDTVDFLHKAADAKAAMMLADDLKKGVAKSVAGFDVSYGAFVGSTDDDNSLLGSLITYGLVAALDYKILNRYKTLSPYMSSRKALSKSEINTIEETYAIENKAVGKNAISESTEVSALKQLEKRVDKSIKLSNIEKTILKEKIAARLRLEKNIGFKVLQKRIREIEANKKLLDTSNELMVIGRQVDDIVELSKDLEMHINDVKKSMEVLSKADKDGVAEDVYSLYKSLHDAGYLSRSAMDKIDYAFKKGKGKGYKKPKIEIVPTKGKNGKVSAKIKVNGKVIKIVGASMLAASGLSASDFGDVTSNAGEIIGLGIVALMLGAGAKSLVFKSGSVKAAMKSANAFIRKSTVFDNTVDFRAKLSKIADSSSTALNETVKPILENTTGKLKEFAGKLYFNPLEPDGKTIEMLKRSFRDTWALNSEKEVREVYKQYIKAQDISTSTRLFSMFSDDPIRGKFNTQIKKYMDTGVVDTSLSAEAQQAIKDAANIYKRYFDEVANQMKLHGVKGAENMIDVKDAFMYSPRIAKGLFFANRIVGISERDKQALIKSFAEMLTQTPADKRLIVAEEYINNITRHDLTKAKTFSREAREELIKNLQKKGLDDNEIDEVISSISGQFGRTKARIHMEYDKFKPIHAKINGEDVTITIDDIFVTDIRSAAEALFNQSAGHISFAASGYKSVDDAISIVEEAAKKGHVNPDHYKTIMLDIYATVGVPSIDYSVTASRVAKLFANVAIGKGMVFSTLSGSEGVVMIQNMLHTSGVFGGMKKLADTMLNRFGDDAFVNDIKMNSEKGLGGFGKSRFGSTFGTSQVFDEFGNINSGVGRGTKYSEIYRDFTLHALPFSRTSDFIERANIQDILDRLYYHVNGIEELKAYEKSAYPISAKLHKYLQENLKLNAKGYVKGFDWTTAPIDIQDDLRGLLENMMAKRRNVATMGTTGAWSRNSALGVGIIPMLKYPMSAFRNVGGFLGRGTLQGDSFAITQTMLWFQAGVLQSIIRSELQGKEYTEQDLVVAGIMNMPQSGAYGTLMGILNPPSIQVGESVVENLSLYQLVKGN